MASSSTSATRQRFRVVVAGGGVSALEAALALRARAGERVALTIATPASVLLYRPLAVMRPFPAAVSYRLELGRIAADLDARLVLEAAVAVDADSQRLLLVGGRQLGYDALLVATARVRRPCSPGSPYRARAKRTYRRCTHRNELRTTTNRPKPAQILVAATIVLLFALARSRRKLTEALRPS